MFPQKKQRVSAASINRGFMLVSSRFRGVFEWLPLVVPEARGRGFLL